MIGREHPLYGIQDVFNGVLLKGNMVGDVVLCGKGAGKLPTASAVVADVIDDIGGIELDITSEELQYINKYISEHN